MTRRPATVAPTAPIEAAAQLMIERKLGGLPMLLDHAVAGILTESDVFRAFTATLGGESAALRVTFEVPEGGDVMPFVVALARNMACAWRAW